MSFEGVNVSQSNGNLGGTAPTEDNVVAIIYALDSDNLPVDVDFNTAYKFIEPADSEAIGFNESHDANNHIRVFGAVQDFFAYAPEGEIWLIPVDIAAPATILSLAAVKTALRNAAKVKGFAIAGLAETAFELANDHAELVQAQIAAWATEHRLFDFCILQGNNGVIDEDEETDTTWAVGLLPDLRELNAPKISICIAQDPFVAAQDPAYAIAGDVGAILGMIAVRKVNENPGSVDILVKPRLYRADGNYTLTRANRWKEANLSNGVNVKSLSGVAKSALSAKGYIYAGSFEGYSGVFFNGGGTAVALTSDYNSIENNNKF